MASDAALTGSAAVAGQTDTLAHEMVGTYAQGRCRDKAATLHAVSDAAYDC